MAPAPTTLLSQAHEQNTEAIPLPSNCFPFCFRAILEAQYAGKYAPEMCKPAADVPIPLFGFQLAYVNCMDCVEEYGRGGSTLVELEDYFTQFIEFCDGLVATSSAVSSVVSSAVSSTVSLSSAPPPATSSSTEAGSTEIFSTSVLRTSVVTSTQAGTTATFTATFTAPGVAVYENFSLTVTTVRSPITSLSLCPQLTINPTYTITGTIPSDWTWGCPPGSRCNPPKIDCNYEVLPADTYYCSPDECVPVYALPSATITTIPFPFVQDYIYLNPSAFGLSVDAVFDFETTLTSTKTYKSTSTASHTPTSTSTVSHTPTPSHSSHKVSTGVIAGSTVGGVASLAITIALLSFFLLRRRRRQKRAPAAPTPPNEKAQLHSEDVKPIRTELDGGIKRKPVPPREMAANEDLRRTIGELPANEIVGSEMESSAPKV